MGDFIYTTAIRKIRNIKKRIKIIQGGTSAGKTFAILPILIDTAIKNKKTSISVVSESFPHLRKGAIRDFLDIMKSTERYIDSHWNRTNSIYTFSNGSYIEFFSADSADKLRGARRNILFVNEANNIIQEAFEQLAMRTDGDIYIDYNPSHSFWGSDLEKSKDAEKIILTYRDNEALSQTIINYLEEKRLLAFNSSYWENWCRVYLDGLQGRLEGVVFDNWEVVDNIPKDAELIGYGLDWGFTNDPSTLIGMFRLDSELYVDEIFYEKGMLNSSIAKRIKSNEINSIIYADSAEPKSIREIKNYGINIVPTKKGKDSILYGIQLLQGYKINITKRSTNLIEEFERYSWIKSKDGQTTNNPIDDYNHCIDSLRYIAIMKIGKQNKLVYKII